MASRRLEKTARPSSSSGRKKDSGKLSNLSAEYVHDSDDGSNPADDAKSLPIKIAKSKKSESANKKSSLKSSRASAAAPESSQTLPKPQSSGALASTKKPATVKDGRIPQIPGRPKKSKEVSEQPPDDSSTSTSEASSPRPGNLKKAPDAVPSSSRRENGTGVIEASSGTSSSESESDAPSQDQSVTATETQPEDVDGVSNHAGASLAASKHQDKVKGKEVAVLANQDSEDESDTVRNATSKQHTVSISEPDFRPPTGFAKTVSIEKGIGLAELSNESLGKRKQLWHITAPSELPIDTIRKAILRTVRSGSKVKSHIDANRVAGSYKDADYSLIEHDATSSSDRLYLPRENLADYGSSKHHMSKLIHVRRKLAVPDISASSSSIAGTAQSRPSPVQPTGLKIRYQPFGIAEGNVDSRTLPVLRHHIQQDASMQKKRKADSIAQQSPSDGTGPSPKKQRKERKNGSNYEQVQPQGPQPSESTRENGDQRKDLAEQTSPEDELAFKKQRKAERKARKGRENVESSQSMVDVVGSGPVVKETTNSSQLADLDDLQETPEERALRKAEKKRRKEEKRAKEAKTAV